MRTLIRSMRADAGFSLVEMAVVVVVLGILVAAALPDLARSNRERQVEAAAEDMASRAQYARQRAVASRVPSRLVVDRDARVYRIQRMVDDSTWVRDPDEDYALPPGVGWRVSAGSDPDNNSEIEFEGRGTVLLEDAPLSVLFGNAQGDTFRLSLVRTGRVVVHRGAH